MIIWSEMTEFGRVKRYIEFNPVSAGLVASPEEFPWSSAHGWETVNSKEWLPHGAK